MTVVIFLFSLRLAPGTRRIFQSWNLLRIACWINSAVLKWKRILSSITRIWPLRRIARARQIHCFWPILRWEPFSTTHVSSPLDIRSWTTTILVDLKWPKVIWLFTATDCLKNKKLQIRNVHSLSVDDSYRMAHWKSPSKFRQYERISVIRNWYRANDLIILFNGDVSKCDYSYSNCNRRY